MDSIPSLLLAHLEIVVKLREEDSPVNPDWPDQDRTHIPYVPADLFLTKRKPVKSHPRHERLRLKIVAATVCRSLEGKPSRVKQGHYSKNEAIFWKKD